MMSSLSRLIYNQSIQTSNIFLDLNDEEPKPEDCVTFLFGSYEKHERFRGTTFFLIVLPAICVIALLWAAERRKGSDSSKSDSNWIGGTAVPVYFFDENLDRGSIVASFGMAASLLVGLILGDIPFGWDHPNSTDGVISLVKTVFVALVLYPIVASVSSRSLIGYIVGSMYSMTLALAFFLYELPCRHYDHRTAVNTVLLYTPMLLCLLYVNVQLPRRAMMEYRRKRNQNRYSSPKVDQIHLASDQHVQYVSCLLKNSRKSPSSESAEYKTHHNDRKACFRYSLSVLIGLNISILICYMLTAYITLKYYELRIQFLDSVEPRLDRAASLFAQNVDSIVRKVYLLNEIRYWCDVVEIVSASAVVIAFVVNAASLLVSFRRYRIHRFNLNRGVYKGIPKYAKNWAPTSLVAVSLRYIGYQLAYSTWGFLIQTTVLTNLLLIIISAGIGLIRYELWSLLNYALLKIFQKLGPTAISMVVVAAIQYFVVHFWFLQRTLNNSRQLALNNRRAYNNLQFFMVFASTPLGILSCVIRAVGGALFGLWLLPRLDLSTMPRGFERFDSGFSSYVCLLSVEHAHTNPVLRVFVSLLMKRSQSSQKHENRLRTLARNRLWLAVSLSRNPALISLRKHASCAGESSHKSSKQSSSTDTNSVQLSNASTLVATGYQLSINVE